MCKNRTVLSRDDERKFTLKSVLDLQLDSLKTFCGDLKIKDDDELQSRSIRLMDLQPYAVLMLIKHGMLSDVTVGTVVSLVVPLTPLRRATPRPAARQRSPDAAEPSTSASTAQQAVDPYTDEVALRELRTFNLRMLKALVESLLEERIQRN